MTADAAPKYTSARDTILEPVKVYTGSMAAGHHRVRTIRVHAVATGPDNKPAERTVCGATYNPANHSGNNWLEEMQIIRCGLCGEITGHVGLA